MGFVLVCTRTDRPIHESRESLVRILPGDESWQADSIGPRLFACYHAPAVLTRIERDGRRRWVFFDGYTQEPELVDSAAPDAHHDRLAERVAVDPRACHEQLEGHYFFCMVDESHDCVIAARDRMGGRALYWSDSGELLVISDNPYNILRVSGRSFREDPEFIAAYFSLSFRGNPERTGFLGVRELPPGGRLEFAPDATVGAARTPFPLPDRDRRPESQLIESFYESFKNSVAAAIDRHQRVAVMTSGGLDSVPVLLEAARTGKRVFAVSWTLPDFPECDEEPWIRQAAGAARVEMRLFRGDHRLPFDRLDDTFVSPDFPGLNGFRELVLECYRLAANEGCGVILNGSQGDQLYADYAWTLFDALRLRDYDRFWMGLRWIVQWAGLRGLVKDPAVRYLASRYKPRLSSRPPARGWLTPHGLRCLPGEEIWPPEAANHPYPAYAARLLGIPMTRGPAQENHFARRFGIDRREPLQSESLVRLMLAAPLSLSFDRGVSKRAMREAMRGRMPESLRGKPRTGLLTAFMRAGFDRNRSRIREFLQRRGHDAWRRYVCGQWVFDTLDSSRPTEAGIVIVGRCIGYQLWLSRVESTGSGLDQGSNNLPID